MKPLRNYIDNYDEPLPAKDLEPIPTFMPSETSFDDDEQALFDGLDKGWQWAPNVTAC